MNVNDVVTVVVDNGREYLGKLLDFDDRFVKLGKPFMVMPTEQGIGFAQTMAMSGEENPEEITIYNYCLMTKTSEQLTVPYQEATSGIITNPTAGKLIM